jgi:hypothetical protein
MALMEVVPMATSAYRERADPAARDNAREVTVIRMARLRSISSAFQKGLFHARPRVSQL